MFSDLGLYIDSLERMRTACSDVAPAAGAGVNLYTGHGPIITDGVEALGEYVEHRMTRVRQVRRNL